MAGISENQLENKVDVTFVNHGHVTCTLSLPDRSAQKRIQQGKDGNEMEREK